MKYIKKDILNEPLSLRTYRSTPGANYDDCNKNDIREALLSEQGYICAYCMQRIENQINIKGIPKTRIEHFEAQSINEDRKLNYLNMLGVCDGNEGNPKHLLHCDQSRENLPLSIDPRNENCEKQIYFSISGEINSSNTKILSDLKKTLNLNQEKLVRNRKKALDVAIQRIKNKYRGKSDQPYSKRDLNTEIAYWKAKEKGRYKPFCQIAIHYLQKKLSRLS